MKAMYQICVSSELRTKTCDANRKGEVLGMLRKWCVGGFSTPAEAECQMSVILAETNIESDEVMICKYFELPELDEYFI